MSYHARQRDKNERPIIDALKAIGASVQQLDALGVPDLLVGFDGRTYLIEVKAEHGKPGIGMKKCESGLRDSQEKWWSLWRGAVPSIATTPAEALTAIGAIDDHGNEVRR